MRETAQPPWLRRGAQWYGRFGAVACSHKLAIAFLDLGEQTPDHHLTEIISDGR